MKQTGICAYILFSNVPEHTAKPRMASNTAAVTSSVVWCRNSFIAAHIYQCLKECTTTIFRVKQSKKSGRGNDHAWRWGQYDPLKYLKWLIQWCIITSQNNSAFSNTAVRISNVTANIVILVLFWIYQAKRILYDINLESNIFKIYSSQYGGYTMGQVTKQSLFNSQQGYDIFLLSIACRLDLQPTQPIQWIIEALSWP